MFFSFESIMHFDNYFKKFKRASQQFEFSVSELLELLFFEMSDTYFEDFLFVILVSELHEYKNVIMFGFVYHVFSQNFDEGINLKELEDRIVLDDLSPGEFDGETVKTFQYIGQIHWLSLKFCTLNFSVILRLTVFAENAFLK